MRRFLLGWKTLGLEDHLQARIVNFADDFVICCRGTGGAAMEAMRRTMDRLKLAVNETKTGHCRIPQEQFDFLGYTFGRCYSTQTGRAYIGTRPSKKSIQKVCCTVSEATCRRWLLIDAEDRVEALNRVLVGWANYFPPGAGQQSLQGGGQSCDRAAAPVVTQETQTTGSGGGTIS